MKWSILLKGFTLRNVLLAFFFCIMLLPAGAGADPTTTFLDLSQGTGSHIVSFTGVLSLGPNVQPDRNYLSAGLKQMFVLWPDGSVYGWGADNLGQLGDGQYAPQPVNLPKQIPGLANIASIRAYIADSAAAIKTNGTVLVWGKNDQGQLGLGYSSPNGINTPIPLSFPVQISDLDIAYGSLAVGTDGSTWRWGPSIDMGQPWTSSCQGNLDGDCLMTVSTPAEIPELTEIIQQEGMGAVLDSTGHVWVWGNTPCSSCFGTVGSNDVPTQIMGLDNITLLSSGKSCMALADDGTAWVWGDNTAGILGLGYDQSVDPTVCQPTLVSLNNIVQVNNAWCNSYYLTQDGSLYASGDNTCGGGLGNGTGLGQAVYPIPVAGLPPIIEVSSHAYSVVAMAADGGIWTWGRGTDGQIGNGSNGDAYAPVRVMQYPLAPEGYFVLSPHDIGTDALLEVIPSDSGAAVGYLFSGDGTTWQTWNGSSWIKVALSESAIGMDSASVTNITPTQWQSRLGGATLIQIAVVMQQGNDTAPSVSQIGVVTAPITPPTITITQNPSGTVVYNQLVQYSADVQCPYGFTCTTQWNMQGVTTTGTTTSTSYSTPGSYSVTATVTVQGFSDLPNGSATTSTMTTVINMPKVSINISGPTVTAPNTPITLTATTTESYNLPGAKITNLWSLPTGTTADTTSVVYNPSSVVSGPVTITYTGGVKGYPESQNVITYIVTVANKPSNVQLSGPTKAVLGVPETYTVSASSNYGTLGYLITFPDGSTADSNSGTFTFSSKGQFTIKAKAYIAEATSLSTEKTLAVTANYPTPTINSLNCPSTLFTNQTGTCAVDAAVSLGTIQYKWSVSSGTAKAGSSVNSENITPTKTGALKVTVTASVAEDPTITATATATITVSASTVTATLSCPSKLLIGQSGTCTANVTQSWSTPAYKWSSTSGYTTDLSGNTSTVNLVYSSSGNKTVTLNVSYADSPTIKTKVSAVISVPAISKPSIKITQAPTTVFKNESVTYSATVTCAKDYPCNDPFQWSINGQTYTGNPVTVAYPTPGSYTVTAQTSVTNYSSYLGKLSVKTNVKDVTKPTVKISGASSIAEGQPLTLTATVTTTTDQLKNLTQVTYWTLPDGSTVQGMMLSYTPTASDPSSLNFKFTAYFDGYQSASGSVSKTVTVTH